METIETVRCLFATRVTMDKALLVGKLDLSTGKISNFEATGMLCFHNGNKNSKPQYYRNIEIIDGHLDPKKAVILPPQVNILYPPIWETKPQREAVTGDECYFLTVNKAGTPFLNIGVVTKVTKSVIFFGDEKVPKNSYKYLIRELSNENFFR